MRSTACSVDVELLGTVRQAKRIPDMTSDLASADIQIIQRILPHRYPFLLVDKVV